MKYKVAIFDLDGTILNTLEDLTDSVNYCLNKYGFPGRTIAEVRDFVGNGILRLIERAVPAGTETEQINAVYEEMLRYYQHNCDVKTKPYNGVLEMLARLRAEGIKTAVVSNKADKAAQALCNKYFEGLFDAVAGEKENVRKKPAPDAVNMIIRELKATKDEVVYIGDSEVDIQTAKNAEVDCISVDWGFRDKEVLVETGAELIVSDSNELFLKIMKA